MAEPERAHEVVQRLLETEERARTRLTEAETEARARLRAAAAEAARFTRRGNG